MSTQILNIFQEHLVEAEPCVQLTVRALFPCSPPVSFQGPGGGSGLPPTSPPPGPPLTRRRQHPGIGARATHPWEDGAYSAHASLPVFSPPSSLPPSSQDSDLPPHGSRQVLSGHCQATVAWPGKGGARVGEWQNRGSLPPLWSPLYPSSTLLGPASNSGPGLQVSLRVGSSPEKTRLATQGLSEVVTEES